MAGEERNLIVKIDNVRKVYNTRNGEMVALNGVDLDIYENEFICVVGPSGCGKSTLLNIIAGLHEATSGAVYCKGKKVTGTGTERGVVFQQYALFPWLTVKKNVRFALEMRGIKGAEADKLAMEYLAKVDLTKFADHYPKELSELMVLLDVWLIPSVFPGSAEEIFRRYQCSCEVLARMGLPIYDEKTADLIKNHPALQQDV